MAEPNGSDDPAQRTAYLIRHVVLPPQLPHTDDRDTSKDKLLLDTVLLALQSLKALVNDNCVKLVATAVALVDNLSRCRDSDGNASEGQLRILPNELVKNPSDNTVPIEIKAQNAALLVSRKADYIVFESFELSPTNEAAMTSGRLKRVFPALASRIPVVKMQQEQLRKTVASTIAKLTTQKALGFQPKVRKALTVHDEPRDTASPAMVTDWFMNLTAALGDPMDTVRIMKNTREEVLWQKGQPWRRSPLWLLLRVSLQLLFSSNAGGSHPTFELYKAFMIILLSHMLRSAEGHSKDLGNEPLHYISAKLLRRMGKFEKLKLGNCLLDGWANTLQDDAKSAHDLMTENLHLIEGHVQHNASTEFNWNLRHATDLDISCPSLDVFITGLRSRKRDDAITKFVPTWAIPHFPAKELPCDIDESAQSPEHRYSRFAAFEEWVQTNRHTWIEKQKADVDTCGKLCKLMAAYHSAAKTEYAGMPTSLSIQHLVLAELWVMCDKSACHLYPLLKEYCPEVCFDEYASLSLPLRSHMARLVEVEQYLQSRREMAVKKNPSVSRDFGHERSFAVRFFDTSLEMQAMKSKIEGNATLKRHQKYQELAKLKLQYQDLMRRYDQTECENVVVKTKVKVGVSLEEQEHTKHDPQCRRCKLKADADALAIEIYEWPLPPLLAMAKAVIFELNPPRAFSDWRDASLHLKIDILLFCYEKPKSPHHQYSLATHKDLSRLLSKQHYQSQRIILMSEIKAHSGTCYLHKTSNNLQEDDVCLDNALVYKYYDRTQEKWCTELKTNEDLPKQFLHVLPQRSKYLKTFLARPPSANDGVPSNEPIASISECPSHFSLEQFRAFGVTPLGRNIMYQNILAQLAMPSLDFAKVECHVLILQIVHEAGQNNSRTERTHHIVAEEAFGNAMLKQLEISLRKVSQNWESWRAAAIFVQLARRVLSLTRYEPIQERSLAFLHEVRQVCKAWLGRMRQRIATTTNSEQITDLYSRVLEVALLCCSTFDVEDAFLEDAFRLTNAISTLLQCSITIRENCLSAIPEFGIMHNIMLHNWRVLSLRMFPRLHQRILLDGEDLSNAISATWAAFDLSTGTRWTILSNGHRNWLCTLSGSLPVHFNLLTGELLITGLPLARLPERYTKHPTYSVLFQKFLVDVGPTNEAGMQFSAKSTHYDQKLHFGMEGNDMLVVATKESSRLELLPARLFPKAFPHAFGISYVHWYDPNRDEVIFRPRYQPWTSNDDDWRLIRAGASWRLTKGTYILLNALSNNGQSLSKVFQNLEDGNRIHTTMEQDSRIIDIKLPRLQLVFYVKPDDPRIYSRQYRGMSIDSDQCIGTLIGLSSKLVLSNAKGERQVLIPVPRTYLGAQSISYVNDVEHHHITITIEKDEVDKVYIYHLDYVLKRVIDNGDLQAKLFLAYLHALSSNCVPEPFTGFTGTESALNILRSAAVHSFEFLSAKNVALLRLIAKLSPVRKFYPPFEKVMQQVTWNKTLPPHSQRTEFVHAVESIFAQAQKTKFFYPQHDFKNPTKEKKWKSSTPFLDERDSARSASFRVCGFGAENFTVTQDKEYASRDIARDSDKGRRAFIAAALITRDQDALHTPIPDLKTSPMSRSLKVTAVIGVKHDFDSSSLQFDTSWLHASSETLPLDWCSIYQCLSVSGANLNKYDIMAWLSTMAYAELADMDAVQALALIYRCNNLFTAQVPAFSLINPTLGETSSASQLKSRIAVTAKSISLCPEKSTERNYKETKFKHAGRVRKLWMENRDRAVNEVVTALRGQRTSQTPTIPSSTLVNTYLDTTALKSQVLNRYTSWRKNSAFASYLREVSQVMAGREVVAVLERPLTFVQLQVFHQLSGPDRYMQPDVIFAKTIPTMADSDGLFEHEEEVDLLPPPVTPQIPLLVQATNGGKTRVSPEMENLCGTLKYLAKPKAVCEREYAKALRTSSIALAAHEAKAKSSKAEVDETTKPRLGNYLKECEEYLRSLKIAMLRAVGMDDGTSRDLALHLQQTPRFVPTFWLRRLNRDQFAKLSESWKFMIIKYGLAITQLHRAQRLFAVSNKPTELAEELSHVGHTNWDPREFPETLLLEVESGIMLREVQEIIARHMRDPVDGLNSVLQLNMGEGKSSTILPVVAAYLADMERLVRVIIGKPQSRQMFLTLVSKLGGLLNRRIYHMPFARDLRPSLAEAIAIQNMLEECIEKRGILLVQPEHILSYKLMGIECLLTGRHEIAKQLLEGQVFLDRCTSDIIDETDEQFSVKLELVYTMGSQRAVEYAPQRWLVIQRVLELLPSLANTVQAQFPKSIEVRDSHDRRFPKIRVLKKDAEEMLLNLLANQVIDSGLIVRATSPELREAVLRYIADPDVPPEYIAIVEGGIFWVDSVKETTLLVRGLIAMGMIGSILESKRWRVNFGLDPSRTPPTQLAVPFRFKDGPALRSDFSHPDVLILLTLLSYYYGGLSDEQMFDAFDHLIKSSQGRIQYSAWVNSACPALPEAFRKLSGIAIKDKFMCIDEIFPYLRHSKNCIDYFLAHLVFPKEVKECELKLSGSGWDLGMTKKYPTVGFSGTNDTCKTLPRSMKQLNLLSQSHTNAMVLDYLLRDEKTSVECLGPHTSGTDAEHLLEAIVNMEPEVRVLLDCGASILEQNNKQVVQTWLEMTDPDHVEAAIFFDDEEMSVLDRNGRVESFQTSPFAQQLDVCIVYLDESHTRGTDLKLPRDYRAGVTLGSGLTKDKLVQGCMRMRKLGHGQSVALILPEEIATKICERTRNDGDEDISVKDVILWCIAESWINLRRSMTSWGIQGHRYETTKHLLNGENTTVEEAKKFLEPEAQSIEARYRPNVQDLDGKVRLGTWDISSEAIAQIVKQLKEFGVMGFSNADADEEQERELAPEKEEERQAERPKKMAAAEHKVHPDIQDLVNTGKILPHHTTFKPAFQTLDSTSAARLFDLSQLPVDLLVTEDFKRTIKKPAVSKDDTYIIDSYLRPVQWILSVTRIDDPRVVQNLVIISPHEANQLRHFIKGRCVVTLHVYMPRTNEGYAPIDNLELYNIGRVFVPGSVPPSLTAQLNLFAGSLYLDSYKEYSELCDFLGLSRTTPQQGQQVYADGFISPPVGKWGLKASPIPFLRALLMRIRREGDGLEKTHLGKILNGVRLEEADFVKDVEMAAEIDKGVELFFSAAIVRAFVFGEFGGGVEGRAGCGLEFDDEDFEDFEGCRDNVPWIWI
ncbi:hypothetical protein HBH98_241660 [Parastagonospora nodorum]|nr:hypothetical protein HBH51_238790 [Parastagonospora nodorum]KAH4334397.1 hypothetical protein HBH98_241660 [Parastagonospora nodorum]KAH4354352.1 hypothetical protein HBH97_250260 [Parastagonospora nodorum]KAH4368396.1 hypothetical protein HBH99_248580 [Parastagonospora nodorum]KAH4893461.1 hypothetical protein HBI80_245680 [Parastagonospora nodorum]